MKKVLICGFDRNQAVFLIPAIKYILGECKISFLDYIEELDLSKSFDQICINCGIYFWELDLVLKKLDNISRDIIFCLSLLPIPQENLDFLFKYKIKYIMVDLENEEEFAFCKKAYLENKTYHSKNAFDKTRRMYSNPTDNYEKLSYNQKCAFNYMMKGKSQKDFQYDFGFTSKGTAATHWKNTLHKFNVDSVIQLRNLFS